jgi:hypothetical protein
MADTFTTYLELTKPEVTGSDDTWGTKLNDVLDDLDKFVAGTHTVATTGGTTTLTDDEAKVAHIGVTGTLASDATIVVPDDARHYVVRRATTGSYKVTFKTSAQTGGVVIGPDSTAHLYVDGTNVTTVSPSDAEFVRYSDRCLAASKSGSIAISLADGLTHDLTITGNVAAFAINDVPSSNRAVGVTLLLHNAGAYTFTWPTGTKWADGVAPSLTSSGIDIVSLVTVDGGTTWYGILGGLAFA